MTGIEKWGMIKSSVNQAAEKILGLESCKQPDWFAEIYTKLQPLITNVIICLQDG